MLAQVNSAGRIDGFWADPYRQRVKGDVSVVLLHLGAESRAQGEGGVGVDLSEEGLHAGTCPHTCTNQLHKGVYLSADKVMRPLNFGG